MYVDLAGLARYKSDFGAWARGRLLPKDAAAARVRTAKAGAVSLVPVQETPLDVSVDFLFSETPPASGDKSPSNPSTITGATQAKVTRCGKNLSPARTDTFSQWGITVTPLSDGGYHITGTADGVNNSHCILGEFLYKARHTYTASLSSANSNVNVSFVGYDANIAFNFAVGSSSTITNSGADRLLTVRISVAKTAGQVDIIVYPQLELGSTATPFEKYEGTDYTIPLGSTFYGGTLDVASGVMTVTHKHVQLTGANANIYFNEDIGTYNRFSITSVDSVRLEPAADYTNPQSCTHFNFAANWTLDAPHFYVATASPGTAYFYSDYATVDALNTWLAGQYQAGTPLEFVYPLATPYTVQLTPQQILSLSQSDKYTPRLNTVYSDAQAVQVGYLKHPSAASADLRNALVSLGGGV